MNLGFFEPLIWPDLLEFTVSWLILLVCINAMGETIGETLLIRKKTIRECVFGSAHPGTNFTKLEFQCHEFNGAAKYFNWHFEVYFVLNRKLLTCRKNSKSK